MNGKLEIEHMVREVERGLVERESARAELLREARRLYHEPGWSRPAALRELTGRLWSKLTVRKGTHANGRAGAEGLFEREPSGRALRY